MGAGRSGMERNVLWMGGRVMTGSLGRVRPALLTIIGRRPSTFQGCVTKRLIRRTRALAEVAASPEPCGHRGVRATSSGCREALAGLAEREKGRGAPAGPGLLL